MNIAMAARAALTACLIAASPIAAAQPMEPGWHHGPGGGELEFLRGLNLTEAQKTQAHAIMKGAFAQSKPLMEQMHALHEQQINMLLTAGSNAAQITPVLKQEASLRNQMEARHLEMSLQLRAILTPEQLAQAADLHAKMEALHEQERETIEGAR